MSAVLVNYFLITIRGDDVGMWEAVQSYFPASIEHVGGGWSDMCSLYRRARFGLRATRFSAAATALFSTHPSCRINL